MRKSYSCLFAFALLAFLTLVASLSAQQGPINPKAVALLRWYPANLTTSFSTEGASPTAVAFDGANIWVANWYSNTVAKLRASDGANLATFTVGTWPSGIAFDGANIWVTSGQDNTVTKLRASDGASLGTFNTGVGPIGVAFDGANIWVANELQQHCQQATGF